MSKMRIMGRCGWAWASVVVAWSSPAAASSGKVYWANQIAGEHLVRAGLDGRIVETVSGDGSPRDTSEMSLSLPLTRLSREEYLYVRVVQTDGGSAWSSPFFVE